MSDRQIVVKFVLSDGKLVYFAVNNVNRHYQSKKPDFCYGFGKKLDFDYGDTYGMMIYQNILILHR